MSKIQKLTDKLLKTPRDFTYDEIVTLLRSFGYVEEERGRTSGSAIMFFNKETGDKIMFHRPHPTKALKKYILELIIDKLHRNGNL